jgi:hypothetical protein
MKRRRWVICTISAVLSVMVVFLLLTFLSPGGVKAKSDNPYQPITITQGSGHSLVVFPLSPQAGEPTEIRVILHNDSSSDVIRYAQFAWSNYGIGQIHYPIEGRIQFSIPRYEDGSVSVMWVPPGNGPNCFYAEIYDAPDAIVPILVLQHNVIFLGHPDLFDTQYSRDVTITVRNPFEQAAAFVLTMTMPVNAPQWQVFLDPNQGEIPPGGEIPAKAVFTYVGNGQFPPSGSDIFIVNALVGGQPIGGAGIEFGPAVRLHMSADPPFAEPEISVDPYPIVAGAPTEICVEVRNITQEGREALVHFRVSPFGIGMPFTEIAPAVPIMIPGLGKMRSCITWVPPEGGQFAFEVNVETPGYPWIVSSRRVMDVNELLELGTTSILKFPVRNPLNEYATVTLGFSRVYVEGWSLSLSPVVLPSMAPGDVQVVTLTVTVLAGSVMPPDGSPVVDVEAFIGGDSIGGFRKIYRPPVPIHRPGDPIYAEREITVSPYPPQAHEPTVICVEVRNPTPLTQRVNLDFNVAEFGIGMPWRAIVRPISVTLPPNSLQKVCVTWVPAFGGRFGVEVGIQLAGHERVYSQRVIDVGEVLLPNTPSIFEFMVRNPHSFPITVTMGAIRYLPQWDVWFEPFTFQLDSGQIQPVVMHVLPVQHIGDPEPQEGEPVIDVEAYWDGNGEHGLLGGFRKLFFPPVPIHRPVGPSYAENEINIFPYPPRAGEPTRLEFEARNPTAATQQIDVTFEWGNLGIGLPFHPIDGIQTITLPPNKTGVIGINWVPPFGGEFCVRVRVDAPFFEEPFYSARNISIVHLPDPYGPPEVFKFNIGHLGYITQPLTVTLGSVLHLPDWQVSLDPAVIVLEPGQLFATAVMTLTPPADPGQLPVDGGPVVDVEGYVKGKLIGGIRRVWRPPVPLGQLGEPSYAESEIVIDPDPPVADQPATFSAQVRNNSNYTQTINLQFGWADFGFGILFTNTNVVPTETVVKLGPYMTTTVSADWTPDKSGHFCVQINLTNDQTGEKLYSQRNVDAIEVPGNQCEPIVKEFLLYNPTPLVITVTIGTSTINLPPGWTYSVDPDEVILQPFEGVTVTLTITPPCDLSAEGFSPFIAGLGSSNPAKIQVEGYDQDGDFVGGVEIQLIGQPYIYLPLLMRESSVGDGGAFSPTTQTREWLPYWVSWFLILGGIGLYNKYFRL